MTSAVAMAIATVPPASERRKRPLAINKTPPQMQSDAQQSQWRQDFTEQDCIRGGHE